jgi:tetratricopeptide (TPR) repeat protein
MTPEHQLLEQHLADGNLDRAESVARHLLSIEPEDVLAHVGLARLDAARGMVEGAMAQLRELVVENPRTPEPLAYLAVLTEHAGDHDKALDMARRSIELGGEVAPALVLVADDLIDGGEMDSAFDLYQRALRVSPSHSGAWLGAARILSFRGLLGQAEDAYINAVQHGPQRVEAWIELVRLEREGGAHEIAQDNLALALRTHPGHPDLLALAREEDAGAAEDPVRQGINDIRSLLYESQHDRAYAELDRLVEFFPDDQRIVIAKAEVTAATGRGEVPPLVHELNRLVRYDPNAWEPKVALGRLLLLDSAVTNPKMAVAHCEDAWQTSGENPHAGISLMEAWAAVGKLALAAALCKRLAEGDGPEAVIARKIIQDELDAEQGE